MHINLHEHPSHLPRQRRPRPSRDANGQFARGSQAETDEEFDGSGGECLQCGNPSDQDEGIPCSNCLDTMCPCGGSLDDGEGPDGQCGSCADQTANQSEQRRDAADAAAARADLDEQVDGPVEGSKEWFDDIESALSDEVRKQRPDAVSYSLMIDDDDQHSYDTLVRISTADGSTGYVETSGTAASDAITDLASYDDDFGTLGSRSYDLPADTEPEVASPEPERLHVNMGDGPIVTSPSGQYGFYTPINGSEKTAGIDKYGPVVQVAQLVRDGHAWTPTPARFHASSVADYRPGAAAIPLVDAAQSELDALQPHPSARPTTDRKVSY